MTRYWIVTRACSQARPGPVYFEFQVPNIPSVRKEELVYLDLSFSIFAQHIA